MHHVQIVLRAHVNIGNCVIAGVHILSKSRSRKNGFKTIYQIRLLSPVYTHIKLPPPP